MTKAVNIDKLAIRPIPPEIQDKVACTQCLSRPARWEFAVGGKPARTYSCSLCLIYDHPKIREQRESLEFVISATEQKVGAFLRDKDGRLRREVDADRIAFGLVMAARYVQARQRNSMVKPDEYFPAGRGPGVR